MNDLKPESVYIIFGHNTKLAKIKLAKIKLRGLRAKWRKYHEAKISQSTVSHHTVRDLTKYTEIFSFGKVVIIMNTFFGNFSV